MKLNTGASHIFARPILYNGVQYLPGDRVPPSVPVNKLRVLVATKHVAIGASVMVPMEETKTAAVEEKTPILQKFEAQVKAQTKAKAEK
jgi:hypothetical protein